VSRAAEFRLASGLASYPTERSADRIVRAAAEAGALVAGVGAGGAGAALAAAGAVELSELEAEYVDRFDRGVAENPLHETGYGRDRAHAVGERLADVAGFYRAFGVDTSGRERLDHVAVELEFYAWLIAKADHLERIGDFEGASIVYDARRKFLADHLGPLAPAIAGRPGIAASAVYGPVFRWIAALVAGECVAMGVEAAPLELVSGRPEPDAVECAAGAALSGRLPVLVG
jgi:nitrate reductase assembly molybdenum cofactor insertion protein NarJ